MTAVKAREWKKKELKAPIDRKLAYPGLTVYVDLRSWGAGNWYGEHVTLPNKDTLTYVLECNYREYVGKEFKLIDAYFPAVKASWHVNNWFVVTYGHKFTALQSEHVLLTADTVKQYKINLLGK